MANPLILTLAIDNEAQLYFDQLRKQYFPPERNFLNAHLTLFHQLPADDASITGDIKSLNSKTDSFTLQVTGLVSIGNGVAFKIESATLQAIHKDLQQLWQQWLIPQDRQKLWPHITIQNKVNADDAKLLLNELSADFKPFEIRATGLLLWEYLGGPWKFVKGFEFSYTRSHHA